MTDLDEGVPVRWAGAGDLDDLSGIVSDTITVAGTSRVQARRVAEVRNEGRVNTACSWGGSSRGRSSRCRCRCVAILDSFLLCEECS